MKQSLIRGFGSCSAIEGILGELSSKHFMLVSDNSFELLGLSRILNNLNIPYTVFNGFTSNPVYEDVCSGIGLFNAEGCDTVLAIGGGSAIDTAKCIKLFCRSDKAENYLNQPFSDSGVPLIAVPTTAGTGSESTRFAVIYSGGIKQSITHDSIIPDYAILDPSLLKTLPAYQKKCTMLDAMCQAVESWWSVNSTRQSIGYSSRSLKRIVDNYEKYLAGSEKAAEIILYAANTAGQAINITQTTAAHAMSYKLSSMFTLPHGHAAALCLPVVWQYMNENTDKCVDKRGEAYLLRTFENIALAMHASSAQDAVDRFCGILVCLGISVPESFSSGDIDMLAASVNQTRLKNNPVELNEKAIRTLYNNILKAGNSSTFQL